jgi:hypothetical protein
MDAIISAISGLDEKFQQRDISHKCVENYTDILMFKLE